MDREYEQLGFCLFACFGGAECGSSSDGVGTGLGWESQDPQCLGLWGGGGGKLPVGRIHLLGPRGSWGVPWVCSPGALGVGEVWA